jgi:hypothetical protein
MGTRTFVLLLHITAQQYAEASRQLSDGNRKASPLVLALTEQGTHKLSVYTRKTITLTDLSSRRRYTGAVPASLAHYIAGFRSGLRVLQDREFELVLLSEDD